MLFPKVPEQVFSMLLSPLGLEGTRSADSRQGGRRLSFSTMARNDNEFLTSIGINVDDNMPLQIVASSSSSDDEDEGLSGQHPIQQQSSPAGRRVRFNDMVGAFSPPKSRRVYAKTPVRKSFLTNKKSIADKRVHWATDSLDSDAAVETSKAVYPTTPVSTQRRRKATTTTTPATSSDEEATSPIQQHMTPRRMSLRSASKAKKTNNPDRSVDATTTEAGSNDASGEVVTRTPVRASRRRSSGIPAPAIASGSPSSSAAVINCKEQKVQALSLLGRLAKSSKRQLHLRLLRIQQQHGNDDDMSEHLMHMVVDYPAASKFLHLLSEHPSLVDVVLMQLNAHNDTA